MKKVTDKNKSQFIVIKRKAHQPNSTYENNKKKNEQLKWNKIVYKGVTKNKKDWREAHFGKTNK